MSLKKRDILNILIKPERKRELLKNESSVASHISRRPWNRRREYLYFFFFIYCNFFQCFHTTSDLHTSLVYPSHFARPFLPFPARAAMMMMLMMPSTERERERDRCSPHLPHALFFPRISFHYRGTWLTISAFTAKWCCNPRPYMHCKNIYKWPVT